MTEQSRVADPDPFFGPANWYNRLINLQPPLAVSRPTRNPSITLLTNSFRLQIWLIHCSILAAEKYTYIFEGGGWEKFFLPGLTSPSNFLRRFRMSLQTILRGTPLRIFNIYIWAGTKYRYPTPLVCPQLYCFHYWYSPLKGTEAWDFWTVGTYWPYSH